MPSVQEAGATSAKINVHAVIFNINLILFSVGAQYIVLSIFNLARLGVADSAVDHYFLQTALIFYVLVYAYVVLYITTSREDLVVLQDKTSPSALPLYWKSMVELLSLTKAVSFAFIANLINSLLSCLLPNADQHSMCSISWGESYRIILGVVYVFLMCTVAGTTSILLANIHATEKLRISGASSYIYTFAVATILIRNFYVLKHHTACVANLDATLPEYQRAHSAGSDNAQTGIGVCIALYVLVYVVLVIDRGFCQPDSEAVDMFHNPRSKMATSGLYILTCLVSALLIPAGAGEYFLLALLSVLVVYFVYDLIVVSTNWLSSAKQGPASAASASAHTTLYKVLKSY
jgi:hypothetical protein